MLFTLPAGKVVSLTTEKDFANLPMSAKSSIFAGDVKEKLADRRRWVIYQRLPDGHRPHCPRPVQSITRLFQDSIYMKQTIITANRVKTEKRLHSIQIIQKSVTQICIIGLFYLSLRQ